MKYFGWRCITNDNLTDSNTEPHSMLSKLWYCDYSSLYYPSTMQGLLADPVIEGTLWLEFEDGLRMGVLPGGCWCPWGGRTYPRINTKPPWGCGLVLGWVWLS